MTATFLLTDIEGSTALWEQTPREMAATLARLDGVAGRVISEHGGTLAASAGGGGAPLAEFEAAWMQSSPPTTGRPLRTSTGRP